MFDAVVTRNSTTATVTLRGEVDLASVARLERAREEAFCSAVDVRIDLRGVEFIDSTGVKFLLVTNSIAHPEVPDDAQIGLSAVVTPELTRIVVSDQGAGFERPDTGLPQGRPGGGYGLYVLNAAASRWDTMKAPGRFSVWFELDH